MRATDSVFWTVAYWLPVPLRPVASFTSAAMVCEPLVRPIVFQVQVMLVALV